ncbi:beta strand repeat-containing protein [Comamonas odontotermitis]|uniref:beta strand repeat-containing protein n=1 Tax=Comamonas odontotermitis TaxID=379895 RepID=UPI0037537E99
MTGLLTTGGLIEMWSTGFSSVNARDGRNFVELNANQASRLYQRICLVQGETVGWQFSHRGRSSTTTRDVAEVKIGAATAVARVGTTSNGSMDTPQAILGSINTPPSPNGGWRDYSGSFPYTGATGGTNFGFESISSAGGDNSVGNFLDNVQLNLTPFVDFSKTSYSTLEGDGAAQLGTDRPTFRVNGVVPAGGMTVTVKITGGSAVRGTDYYTNTSNGTSDTLTIVVPAGIYDGISSASMFQLPIYIAGNTVAESNRTIGMAIQPAAQYARSSNDVCGQDAAPAVYTIVDDDGPLNVTKTVASAPVPVSGKPDQFDIGYTVVVTNDAVSSRNYTLTDTPGFDGDVTINSLQSLTCVRSGGNNANCGGNGPTLPVNSAGPWALRGSHVLASGETETYSMVVRFTIKPGKVGADICDGTAGKGLFNSVTANVTGSGAGSSSAAACQNTPTPVWVTLNKSLTGRIASTDQFQIRMSSGGIPASSATTTGTTVPATATTGLQVLQAGKTLQFFEALKANGTGADQLPSAYTSSISCTGSTAAAPSGPGTAQGTQLQWPEFNPVAGDNIVCTITNAPITYNVTATVNPVGGGVVNGGSASCTPSPVASGVSSTCQVTTITPGWSFTGWTGAACSQGQNTNNCTLTPTNADMAVVANFSPLPGTLTVSKTVSGGPSPLPALSFPFTVNCTGGSAPFSTSSSVSAGSSAQVTGIPAGSTCSVTEGSKPAVPGYTWGAEQITNPSGAMAPGGALAAGIANSLSANPGTLTVSKTVTGGPSPLPALSFPFSVSCTGGAAPAGGFSASGSVSVGSSASVGNIPAGSSCTVTEGAKPPVANYTWGTEQITNPGGPMAAGGTLAATIANSLTRDQVSVTINKTVTGAPATGAPGNYGFSLVCDTGTYTGAVGIAANGVSGSTTVQVPKGATCSALNETGKATPPANYSWAAESTTPPAGAIATGAVGSIVNPLKTNAKVTLQKTGPRVVLTGEQFNYTLTLTNTGELPTGPVLTVQDLLPEGMEFVSAQGDICTGAASDKQTLLTCAVPGPLTEAGGATPSATFTVTVKAPATAGALTNYAATHPSGSGNPPSPPGAACDATTTSCANWSTDVNTPAALTVEKSAPAINAAAGLNQYTASYQLTVRNTGGSEGSYTLSDTPGFAGSATLTSINAQPAGGGVLGGSAFPRSNPANGAEQQIGASSLPIAAGATHTYTVTIDYTMVGGTALACNGSAGNGAFNTASITGTTAASANACGDLTGQATAGITLKKAWSNGKSGDAVSLAITGSGVTGAVGGSSAVGGAVVDATATAIVGSTVAIAEGWTAGNSANYDVAYSCDNGIGAVTSFAMPNAAVTCTVTNTRKSAQLKLAKQWINGTSGETVNITAAYNGTTASIISTATDSDKTDTGTNAATVYAGDVLTLPEEVFSNPDNAAKYTKTVSCSAGSLAGKDLTVPAGAPELLCTYKNSGLPQVSATKVAEPAALIKGASGQKYVITVTVAGAPTTDVITIADALPSGIKLSGAPTVEAGTGASVPKLEACGAAGDTSLGANCVLSGTTSVALSLGTYIITIPIDTSDATVGTTAGTNTAHLSGGGDPACKLDGNPLACNPSTEDVPVNTPAALTVEKSAPAINAAAGLNQYTASYQLTVRNTGGSEGSYTLSDTPGFAGSATLTSINAQPAGGGVLGGSAFPRSNPANGAEQQIGASSLPIAAGATHTYTVTIDYTMVGGTALACNGSAGNGAFNTASITGTTAASANACGDLTGQATAGITLKKAWSNGKSGDAVSLAITGSGVTGAVGGSSAVGGAVVDATATAIVGSTVAIAEGWTAGNSANYDVAYSCDNGIGAVTSFAMPNAAVTCTVTNTRKSAQLKLAKQWINGTSGETVNITAAYNGTTASIISTATDSDKTDTGTNAATVYAGDVLTLPEEVFSNPDNAAKYTKTVSCSAGSLAGKDLTVPAGAPELLCTYKNSGLPQVSATKVAEPAALIKGASGQKYVITVTVAGAPTTDVITIADALPSGIKLSGAPTVEAGTGASVPKLEACGAAGDTSLGANCVLSGTTSVALSLGTYIITIPIDTSDATVGTTAGTNTAHLSGGGDPACKLDGNPLACNPSTEDVPVNMPAALLVSKTNGVNQLTAGTQTTYTVTITNTGGTVANGVEWRDAVVSGLSGITSIAPGAASAGSDLGTCAGLACTGITVAANGGSVSYTVTGTVGAAAPGARAVNTANVVGGGCVAGVGTEPSTPASCTATDSDPIEPVPPVVVDPPFITKAAALGSDGHVKWSIVLDNPNPAAMVVQMRDPMPDGMTFVSGSVSCAANGASTVVAPPAGCYYDQANNRLVVDATLAPDNGTATGANRVEVVFEAQFVATPAPVTNTAQACWDTQNDPAGINACTASLSAAATYTPGPKPPAVPAPVPVDSRTMLLLLAVLLMLAAGWQSRSGRR